MCFMSLGQLFGLLDISQCMCFSTTYIYWLPHDGKDCKDRSPSSIQPRPRLVIKIEPSVSIVQALSLRLIWE